MSTKTIEQHLAALQKRVAALEAKARRKPLGTWMDVFGMAKDDDLFPEAMKLGAEWRKKENRRRK